MGLLNLSLLGPFSATVDDNPLTPFRTKAAQALLIYLVCEGQVAQRREHLMTLLWPDLPQKSAQGSLRQALYLLKRTLPDVPGRGGDEVVPLLLADRATIQLNPEADFELDVADFESLLAGPVEGWPAAIELCRGPFLADFYLPDSVPFEEWALARREAYRRQALDALERLAADALTAGELETAEEYARKQVAVDDLRESGHRHLMQALTLSGRRTEALAQYETLQLLLERELGAEPSAETIVLYESILSGQEIIRNDATVGEQIAPIEEISLDLESSFPLSSPGPARPLFVARQAELARLAEFLEEALVGQGQVAFLAGDAGSGKSSLMATFAAQASQDHKGLLVAGGICSAFSGRGDPYLPFRDVLSCLTGDIERPWSGGRLTTDQGRALWSALPLTIEGLLDYAPDLLDSIIPRRSLKARIERAFPPGHPLLAKLDGGPSKAAAVGGLEQPQLFEQTTELLHHLAQERPLLILLDDLQWIDSGSLALLFHLGRRLTGSRILVLGAYRQDEITARPDHPLQPLLEEFRRTFGDAWLELNQAPGKEFVEAYLDSETNCLDEKFREMFYRRTGGHPLFTVELLRDMQERGDLVWNEGRGWTAGLDLDWDTFPARVEGAIAARISRLEPELRAVLAAAAVVGQTFTAQVIARVLDMPERSLLRMLSGELEKRHGLIQEDRSERLGEQMISRYHFAHQLFQDYLVNGLSAAERQLLHGDVGEVLESLYDSRRDEIAVELAHHFTQAGRGDKAVAYLLSAGDSAREVFAYQEAIQAYEQAMLFLEERGDHERAARTLMKLGLTYHNIFDFEAAQRTYERGFDEWQKAADLGSPDTSLMTPAPHPFRAAIVGDPVIIDPPNADATGSWCVHQLFGGLLQFTASDELVPDIAHSWEILDEGHTYVFHLRDDVRWSDGRPVTAADFEYAWKRALHPDNTQGYSENLFDIVGARAFKEGRLADPEGVGIQATDQHTLLVELENPSSYFLQLMALPIFMPVPRHVVERYGLDWTKPENIATNGPFTLKSWIRDTSITFERYKDYHGRFRGNVSTVDFQFVPGEVALELYERDELDILYLFWHMSPQDSRVAIRRHPDEFIPRLLPMTSFLAFNTLKSPFDDPRVRRALVLATDRNALANSLGQGFVFPAEGGLIPPGMAGHVPDIALPYDPDLARKILAKAGYPDGWGLSTIQFRSWPQQKHLFEILSAGWQECLGLQVIFQEVPFWEMYDQVKRDPPDIWYGNWHADYPDPDNFLRVAPWLQASGWFNRNYEALVQEARSIPDQRQRMTMYRQAEQILVEEAPVLPLVHDRFPVLVKPWGRGLQYSMFVLDIFKDAIIEPH